jgi:hypothetical protein
MLGEEIFKLSSLLSSEPEERSSSKLSITKNVSAPGTLPGSVRAPHWVAFSALNKLSTTPGERPNLHSPPDARPLPSRLSEV